jgi:nucleotide-binding universal stress UspA family protein
MTLHQLRPVEHGTFTPNAVLVAVDCSRTSLRAVDYAAGQARRNTVGLVGVYVRRSKGMAVTVPGLWAQCAAVEDQIAAEAEQYLAECCRNAGLPYGFAVLDGPPARQIRRLADELRASALVVGASERSAHRVYGSLAVTLARNAARPVIIVP